MRQHLESFGAVVCVDEAAFGTNKVYHAVQHMPDLVTFVFSVILSSLSLDYGPERPKAPASI